MSPDPCTQSPSALLPARPTVPRVVSIAGTDPTGGAGTAADLKSITAAGGYGMAVVTAVVAQNTHGVCDIHVPPAEFLAAQLTAVSDDVTLEAVKTGMLGTVEVIEAVAAWIDAHPPRVLVVDPVMVATSGHRLLEPAAERAMLRFCRRASVVTPNIDELAVLTGAPRARTEDEALAQAGRWAAETGVAVLVKTGHLEDREVTNTWVEPDGSQHRASSARVETTSTHGTGCSLASALATRLGAGHRPAAALAWATQWLHEAIVHGAALQVGTGHGPVDHAHQGRRLAAAGSAAPWLRVGEVPARLEAPEDLIDACSGDAGTETGIAPVLPVVAPAGPWTAALWAAGSSLAAQVADSGFVRALVDGSLPGPAFDVYLAQDALYLARYSRALAALAEASTTASGRTFWAESSRSCLTVEAELHRSWLSAEPAEDDTALSPVTSAYTDFLLRHALGSPTPVVAAAVLPCFWLYAQVGGELAEIAPGHPYAAWLETYRDPGFVEGVQGALGEVERELAAASPVRRAAAARAFLLACRHELEFFEQARRLAPHDAPAEAALSGAVR
ncbi:bifunctional hydroxymethylpyrimidine kinase/phosphomethylpyrimidine kinase [Brachybacterium vulturis]|uniref:Bifunctional hydroxymethylpyrimidine kinase/phosphomethylpyrimidine kinase n=1 Tax=Brachybacterium vulturis TaxID=2017484 RepID=A0A291GL50_9MICO|nr:bifunctional hydroxymethylpyrimidine kinase/phosphomethylpyrimidine kinase [Brachybacterium vulturis]ATG50951.1 bifunctional hydroxymethylpyrimidine kinase/phosphomethylpyrimidine kinase [Brachybacterium vulturis]